MCVAGTEVRLVTRTRQQAQLINHNGIIVHEGDDREVRTNIMCTSFEEPIHADGPSDGRFDWIFLMVKQTHINAALLNYVMKTAAGSTKLLCFQNGVGHVERLVEASIPANRIYVAVTTEAARKDVDNAVAHTGAGITSIGCVEKREARDAMFMLENVLKSAGFHANIAENIETIVWKKLLVNSVINPLTSIMGIRNGQLLSSPHCLKLMESLHIEACEVLQRYGLHISDELWEQLLEVCKKTSANSSSMLQDLLAGRETEIEWINGSLIRLAAKQHIKIPAHEAVYNMVKGLEQLKRSKH